MDYNNFNNDLIELGSLWEEVSRSGKKYYSGSFGPKARLLLFPIDSQNPKAPKFNLCVAPRQQDERKATDNHERLRYDDDIEF